MSDDEILTALRENGWKANTFACDDHGVNRKIILHISKEIEKPEYLKGSK